MEPIKAFVGHSFTPEDESLVAAILKCLDRVAQLHPRFSWEHAEQPEPTFVDEKVLSLLADKNLFIGICTRKERVISPSALSPCWYSKKWFVGKESDFQWKTSDWIIQEIGVAIGRGMKIILLVEDGTKLPGALQGNLEHVPLARNSPEKCFDKLLGMIAALTPQPRSVAGATQGSEPQSTVTSDAAGGDTDWATPKPDWDNGQYDSALFHSIILSDKEREQRITDHYLASALGKSDAAAKLWEANREYYRIIYDCGGDLSKFEQLSETSPSSEMWANLARCYLHYKEHSKAGVAYEKAADLNSDTVRVISLLGSAALAHHDGGDANRAVALEDQMMHLSEDSGKGEEEVLEAEKALAETRKDNEVAIAALERLLELTPGDNEKRFSLAYKWSDAERADLAAYHYSRIPDSSRSAIAWNNYGVALSLLGLPIKSVTAYRQSEKLGETLAMSNLAHKFLDGGFLKESSEILDTAIKTPDHNKNIDKALGTVESRKEAEKKEEAEIEERSKPISEYYRQFGRALAKPLSTSIEGKWRGPKCDLEFTVTGSSVVGIGSWEVKAFGLITNAMLGGLGALGHGDPAPTRFIMEIRGKIQGRTIIGTVASEAEPEFKSPSRASTILTEESRITALIWIGDEGDKLHVLERPEKNIPKSYVFERITESAQIQKPAAALSRA